LDPAKSRKVIFIPLKGSVISSSSRTQITQSSSQPSIQLAAAAAAPRKKQKATRARIAFPSHAQ
jgi:hypothetical protein